MCTKVIDFIKKETVLSVSLLLAIVSMFWVHPSMDYVGYIDFRVLAILFCLMVIVAGFRSIGVFDYLGHAFLSRAKTIGMVSLILVLLCFFSSMIITNDVALLTFVPFSILILGMLHRECDMIWLITLETIAANLGSMLTPLGNPQNLYLYTISGMNFGEFVMTLLPYTIVSLVLLCGLIFARSLSSHSSGETQTAPVDPNIAAHASAASDMPTDNTIPLKNSSHRMAKRLLADYLILFFLSLLVVFHVLNYWLVLAVVILVLLLRSPKLFAQVDYSLLFTFVCFFVFIGNMKNIPVVNSLLSSMLIGHETITGVLASQVISNVPAAILLSGFTTDYPALLIGVNLGGLGTLIASLASLISYRFYVRSAGSHKGKYLAQFTLYNVLFLVILLGLYHVI